MIPVGFPSSRAGFVIFFFICARACGSIALPAARIWRVRVVGARVSVTRAVVGNFSRFRAGFGRFFILGLFLYARFGFIQWGRNSKANLRGEPRPVRLRFS